MGKRKSPASEVSRDSLIEKVARGELSPADADREAVRHGFGTLTREPDPANFDPMQEQNWSLPMAVAWITYRSPDAVRNWWNDYRKEFSVWRYSEWQEKAGGPVHQGYDLQSRPVATLVRLQMVDTKRQNAEDCMSAEEAIMALWQALQSGDFEATGVVEGTGQRVEIPAVQWYDLTWFEEREKDVIRTGLKRAHLTACYHDVIVPAKAVRARWPVKPQPQLALPELMKPEGPGYMPLYCAAQWIATCGGSVTFDPSDESVWKKAYDQLLARIASEEIKTIGVRDGKHQIVPGYHFAACRVDYPFSETPSELYFSENLYLWSNIYLDEEHWLKGSGDCLEDRRGPQWERLMVLKSDVAEFWPFEAPRTGAPGRPSSMYLIEAEFEARCARNEVAETITDEAELLADWLKSKHPTSPRLKAKSIRNKLSPAFRRHKSARN